MTDQEVLAAKDDAQMMRRPHLWEYSGFLPLVRREDDQLPEHAVLDAGESRRGQVGLRFRVYLTTLGELFDAADDGKLPVVDRAEFATFEDLVAAGWQVD